MLPDLSTMQGPAMTLSKLFVVVNLHFKDPVIASTANTPFSGVSTLQINKKNKNYRMLCGDCIAASASKKLSSFCNSTIAT
jgi:hypothetical protein